ncbi:MAG: cadherin-like beta sandwich domain-containing protein [Breznakia sp.]
MIKKIKIGAIACICSMLVMVSTNIVAATTIYVGEMFTARLACGVREGRFDIRTRNATLRSRANWCDRNKIIEVRASANATGSAAVEFVSVSMATIEGVEIAAGTVLSSTSVSVISKNTGGGSSGGGSSSGGSGSSSGNSGGSSGNSNNAITNQNNEIESKSETNLNLKSLSISKGKLSPAFDPETIKYIVEVTSDVKEITLDAKALEEGVSVSGVGTHKISEGENVINIKVADRKGNEKVYTVQVNVEKAPTIFLDFQKQTLGVLALTSAPLMDGFETYKLTIDGKEIEAKKKSLTGLIVLYMMDKDTKERNYYIYNEAKKQVTSIYIPIALLGNTYAIISIPKEKKEMSGYIFETQTIDKQKIEGWSFKDKIFENYALVYLMDEKDKENYYQYEKTQNTLQIFDQSAPITQKAYEQLQQGMKDKKQMVLFTSVVAVSLSVLLLAILGTLLVVRIRKRQN